MIGGMQVAKVNRRRNVESGQLPPGTALDTVDDPGELVCGARIYAHPGTKIVAVRSYRDDPLALMHSRQQIDAAQFRAGREWERLYRLAEPTPIMAMDTTKEPVDGGGNVFDMVTVSKLEAMSRLGALGAKLGARDEQMLNHVLITGMGIREYAHATEFPSAKAVKLVIERFREALEMLAKEFGYA